MAKKLKLPKRIAGVKIPKAIRKGAVAQFMNSAAGQLVIAEALVAAAGAFAVKKTDPSSDATPSSELGCDRCAQASGRGRATCRSNPFRLWSGAHTAFDVCIEGSRSGVQGRDA
jgi:hypothetical protein